MLNRLEKTIELIDLYNKEDPQQRELDYSARLTAWVLKLKPDASDLLRIAARGQHIGRWKISRGTYDLDRRGYLKWREDLKRFHAEQVGIVMKNVGYQDDEIQKTRNIIRKRDLRDADTQVIEDALCLVFLETQFTDLKSKTSEEKMIEIVRKTWNKMSPAGKKLALGLNLPAEEKKFLGQAIR